jgi:hypothetical protein
MPPREAVRGLGVGDYFRDLSRAREIDPKAFRGVRAPHFTDEQIVRQRKAFEQAERERKTNGNEA